MKNDRGETRGMDSTSGGLVLHLLGSGFCGLLRVFAGFCGLLWAFVGFCGLLWAFVGFSKSIFGVQSLKIGLRLKLSLFISKVFTFLSLSLSLYIPKVLILSGLG